MESEPADAHRTAGRREPAWHLWRGQGSGRDLRPDRDGKKAAEISMKNALRRQGLRETWTEHNHIEHG